MHKARITRIAEREFVIVMKRKATEVSTLAKRSLAEQKGVIWGWRSVCRHRAKSALFQGYLLYTATWCICY
jgi:hypothetical protein